MCAKVRLGSISMRVGWREMLESLHFWGRNIFQLIVLASLVMFGKQLA